MLQYIHHIILQGAPPRRRRVLLLLLQSMEAKITSFGSKASDFVIGNGEFPQASPTPTDPALDIELETFYRSIPASGDAFEYTWFIEDYVHGITSPTAPP